MKKAKNHGNEAFLWANCEDLATNFTWSTKFSYNCWNLQRDHKEEGDHLPLLTIVVVADVVPVEETVEVVVLVSMALVEVERGVESSK